MRSIHITISYYIHIQTNSSQACCRISMAQLIVFYLQWSSQPYIALCAPSHFNCKYTKLLCDHPSHLANMGKCSSTTTTNATHIVVAVIACIYIMVMLTWHMVQVQAMQYNIYTYIYYIQILSRRLHFLFIAHGWRVKMYCEQYKRYRL